VGEDEIETAIAGVAVATVIATSATPVAEIAVAIETGIGDNKDDRSKTPSPRRRTSVETSGKTTANVADVKTVVARTVVAMRVVDVIAQSAFRATPSAPLLPHPLSPPLPLRLLR